MGLPRETALQCNVYGVLQSCVFVGCWVDGVDCLGGNLLSEGVAEIDQGRGPPRRVVCEGRVRGGVGHRDDAILFPVVVPCGHGGVSGSRGSGSDVRSRINNTLTCSLLSSAPTLGPQALYA